MFGWGWQIVKGGLSISKTAVDITFLQLETEMTVVNFLLFPYIYDGLAFSVNILPTDCLVPEYHQTFLKNSGYWV